MTGFEPLLLIMVACLQRTLFMPKQLFRIFYACVIIKNILLKVIVNDNPYC